MNTPAIVTKCDAVSLAKAIIKIDIWNQVKAGTIQQSGTIQDPDERIAYWTAQRDKYADHIKNAGFEIFPFLIPVWTVISQIFPFVLDEIKKLLNITL